MGTQLAADRINKSGGINGRPVELVIADYESKPDVGRRKAEKLVVEITEESLRAWMDENPDERKKEAAAKKAG